MWPFAKKKPKRYRSYATAWGESAEGRMHICNECEGSARAVVRIEHHRKCLTGRWEKERRKEEIVYMAPKPRPFRRIMREQG